MSVTLAYSWSTARETSCGITPGLHDQLTTSISSSTTTIPVADSSVYRGRWQIEVDYETMMIRSAPSFRNSGDRHPWLARCSNGLSRLRCRGFDSAGVLCAGDHRRRQHRHLRLLPVPVQPGGRHVPGGAERPVPVHVIPNMPGTTYPIPNVYHVDFLQPGDLTYRVARR